MTQLGKYIIKDEIGRGGFGVVYQAHDTSLDRDVALKVLHPPLTVDPDFLRRFRDEARALARVNHPNVVTIYEIGETEGRVYIAMEYLSGGSLADRLKDGPLSPKEALTILRQAAQGLAAGHEEGLVHRDIKPGNILFNKHGQAVIADFGLARAMVASSATAASSFGGGVGTPYYRAPELWNGTPPPSPATDVYGLACVYYEMVTGRLLFGAETPSAVMLQHFQPLDLGAHWPEALPEGVRPVLTRALAQDPADRFTSVDALAAALTAAQAPQPPAAPPDAAHQDAAPEERGTQPNPESPRRPEKRLPKWAWWAGGLTLIGLILGGLMIGVGGNLVAMGRGGEGPLAMLATATGTPTRTPTPTLGVGSTMNNPVDGAAMVYVPAGDFLMGSEDSDADSDEDPEHTVYLDAYWVYQYEVTNVQYAAFLNEMGNQSEGGATWLDAGDSDVRIFESGGQWEAQAGYGDHPVVEVSWYGAQAYCEWAGGGLPTEVEWEKAARGTDGRIFPWGDGAPTCILAQYSSCSGQTVPVGSFPEGASPYGALDMAGNVWEWVADWYDADYYSQSPDANPLGPGSGSYRVLRGGSWFNIEWLLRVSSRNSNGPVIALDDLGFRCRLFP